MEKNKTSINLEDPQEVESELAEARLDLSNMDFDLKNGRYPNGVPVEYDQQMERLREYIARLEDALEDLK